MLRFICVAVLALVLASCGGGSRSETPSSLPALSPTASTNASPSLIVEGKPVTVTVYPVPFPDRPFGITMGSGGTAWFASGSQMSRITPGGNIKSFQSPEIASYIALSLPNSAPILTAPDDSVWFVGSVSQNTPGYCVGCSEVMRIRANGQFTLMAIPPPLPSNFIYNIANGPNDTVWVLYTEHYSYQYRLAALSMDGSVKFEKVFLQGAPFGSSAQPQGMAMGADGAMYISVALGVDDSELERYDENGNLTRRIKTGLFANTMITGPDGNLWLLPYGTLDRIERVTLAGSYTDFTFPTSVSLTTIAVGGDGALWIGDYFNTALWRVTTAGRITRYRMNDYGGRGIFGVTSRLAPHVTTNRVTLWFTQKHTVGKFQF